MSRIRLISLAAGAATLLITTGTAVALTSQDAGTPASPTPSALTSTEPTESTEVTESTESTESTATTEDPPSTADVALTGRAQAIQIALASTGGGTVTEVEAEIEHGRPEWKVRVVVGGRRIDVRVDVATGTVTRFEDRATDDRGGDDHGGDDHGDDHGGDDHGGGNRGRH